MRAWAARRDDNERGIIQALELAGWVVIQLSGKGVADLIAMRKGVIVLLEVKTRTGKLTPAQVLLHARARLAGVTIHVARTPEDALAAVRREAA